jgi:hypothetical protein
MKGFLVYLAIYFPFMILLSHPWTDMENKIWDNNKENWIFVAGVFGLAIILAIVSVVLNMVQRSLS